MAGSGKFGFGDNQWPKTISGEGSAIVAASAKAFDMGRRSSMDDTIATCQRLSIVDEEETRYSRSSPTNVAYQDSLASARGVSLDTRILAFELASPESFKPIDLSFQHNRRLKPAKAASAQFSRFVPMIPERVLDIPDLVDDYYLNLLDWSSANQVAVSLKSNVYVWSAESGTVSCLLETSPDTYVSSVKWSGDGAYVSVGLGTGEVQLWDVEEATNLRSMHGHETRVGVMGWNKHTLSTGAQSGIVFNHDIRIRQHKVAELVSHTSDVCGLEWCSSGAQLATGGNDNLVSIWDARSLAAPKFTKTDHKSVVRTLGWCPWKPNLLATGGGSDDHFIHFWNSTSGARVKSICTGSQVTSLHWSPHCREFVSSGGYPNNSFSIWRYPGIVRIADIPAHESRVLQSCLSPDGQTLATAAAGENLKFWKIFEKTGSTSASSASGAIGKPDMFKQMTIG